ncbi:GTP-binding protein [Streptomyces sp. LZ34]
MNGQVRRWTLHTTTEQITEDDLRATLLNRILTEQHGLRIAVIENEFGEVGVDDALVLDAEEEIFEMNNGCICCTVRGDLIRILGALMRRRETFGHILIETTGLADPAPVAQTFFMDGSRSPPAAAHTYSPRTATNCGPPNPPPAPSPTSPGSARGGDSPSPRTVPCAATNGTLLIAAYRDGRVQAHRLPSRTAL